MLEKKHDPFNLHKKVKEVAGLYKPYSLDRQEDNNGEIILDKKQKIKTFPLQ